MPVNYKVYEDFTHFGASEVYGWTVSEGVNSSNELVLANNSSARKSFDGANGKVAAETYFILPDGGEFELVEHDDYVPEPTARANYDDYAVGVNVCSLWRNGDHYGWACITPYDEPRPVL